MLGRDASLFEPQTCSKLALLPLIFGQNLSGSCSYLVSDHTSCPARYTFCRAFLTTLNELNDYAGQHEVIAENLTSQIIAELSRHLQELKSERKSVRPSFFHIFFPRFLDSSPHACALNQTFPTDRSCKGQQKHCQTGVLCSISPCKLYFA